MEITTEYFTDKNGVEMRKDTYPNGMTIEGEADGFDVEDNLITPSLSQLDHIEAATEYLMAMQE